SLGFAARETPTRLANNEIAETKLDRAVARSSHGRDVTPLVDEICDGEALDVGPRATALDEVENLPAVASAGARIAGLRYRWQKRHALLPGPFPPAGVAAVA